MATISELVAWHSKVPGDMKVTMWAGTEVDWFQPFFFLSGFWFGPTTTNNGLGQYGEGYTGWTLYTEPKPKVKRAQYLIIPPNSEIELPFIGCRFFQDDAEALEECQEGGLSYRVIRLPKTEREFDW